MNITEVRKLSTKDLATTSVKLRDEIIEMRRRLHQGEVKNVRIIRSRRKDLARVLTVMQENLLKEDLK